MVSNSLELLTSFQKYSSTLCDILSHKLRILLGGSCADEVRSSQVLDNTTCLVSPNEVVSQATDKSSFYSLRVCGGGANKLLESLACKSAALHGGLEAFDDKDV